MKTLLTLLLSLILFGVVAPTLARAATVEVTTPLVQKEYPASKEISVPIHIKSDEAFNAYTVTVEFQNLEYVKASYDQKWTAINGPYQNGNTITFTAALLGKDKYARGDSEVINITFRTPATETFTLKAAGTVALTDAKATQVSGEMQPVTFPVTSSLVKSTMFSFENSKSLIFQVLRVGAVVLVLAIGFFMFRMRRRRPGRKPTYG